MPLTAFRPFRPFRPFRNLVGGTLTLEQQIAALFANDEEGAWYDPSDSATLFQDAAGTIPADSVEDPVRLMQDKSGNGNHATAPSDAARPLLGRTVEGGRRNLLTYTEQFDNAAWKDVRIAFTPNAIVAPDGTETAYLATVDGESSGGSLIYQTLTAGVSYTFSVYLKKYNHQFTLFRLGNIFSYIDFDAVTASNGTIESVGDGWFRCTITGVTTVGFCYVYPASMANSRNTTGLNGKGCYIWGAQLEEPATPTNYQRVGSALDVTEAGKAELYYLSHDLDDDGFAVTLPDLGADATVATANEDGVTVTGSQTIGAGAYNLPSAKAQMFGDLLIDRALTAKETEALTSYLEGKAGVV